VALGPTHPPIQWVSRSLSPGVKWLGCEADDSPLTSAKVKNAWSYTSTSPYVYMVWCLVKHGNIYILSYESAVWVCFSVSLQEGVCHAGTKACKVVFLGNTGRVLTTGFSRHSDRQYAIWNQSDLSTALCMETIDCSSGVLFPYYDHDTHIVFLAGKVSSVL